MLHKLKSQNKKYLPKEIYYLSKYFDINSMLLK